MIKKLLVNTTGLNKDDCSDIIELLDIAMEELCYRRSKGFIDLSDDKNLDYLGVVLERLQDIFADRY